MTQLVRVVVRPFPPAIDRHGRIADALRFYRLALKGREATLGETHPDTLDVAHAVAATLQAATRFDHNRTEAEMLLRRFLRVRGHRRVSQ